MNNYKSLLIKHDDKRILSFCDYLIWKFINGEVDNLVPEKVKIIFDVLSERMDKARLKMDLKLVYHLKKMRIDIQFILDIINEQELLTI